MVIAKFQETGSASFYSNDDAESIAAPHAVTGSRQHALVNGHRNRQVGLEQVLFPSVIRPKGSIKPIQPPRALDYIHDESL
jgi:hypothetical protein